MQAKEGAKTEFMKFMELGLVHKSRPPFLLDVASLVCNFSCKRRKFCLESRLFETADALPSKSGHHLRTSLWINNVSEFRIVIFGSDLKN